MILERSIPHPKHLPYIEVEKDLSFFLPNAAICYLLPFPQIIDGEIYEWLEWESKLLSPSLAQLGSSVKNDKLKTCLEKYLKSLDQALNTKKFLVGVSCNI